MTHCIYCGKKFEGKETVCPGCGKEIREYHSPEEYAYKRVPPAVAEMIEAQKVGLLFKGDAKKLAEAARNGKVQTAEVLVDNVWTYTELESDDSEREYEYANIADLEGYPSPKAVINLGEIPKAGETAVLFRFLHKKHGIMCCSRRRNMNILQNILLICLLYQEMVQRAVNFLSWKDRWLTGLVDF